MPTQRRRAEPPPPESPILSPLQFYCLAIEVGNYRAAVRACILGLRLYPHEDRWRHRLVGAMKYRNGRPKEER